METRGVPHNRLLLYDTALKGAFRTVNAKPPAELPNCTETLWMGEMWQQLMVVHLHSIYYFKASKPSQTKTIQIVFTIVIHSFYQYSYFQAIQTS